MLRRSNIAFTLGPALMTCLAIAGTAAAQSTDKPAALATNDYSRTDDIVGDVVVGGQVQADWGLHLIDVNLAMGNLVEIVGRQSKAYRSASKIKK